MLNRRDDTMTLLHTRRSAVVASMGAPGPSAHELDQILAAATRVPDHGKLAPWRVQVLREAGQAALGDHLATLFAADHPTAHARQIEFERRRPARAPLLLVVTAKIVTPHKIPELEQLLSGGAVCGYILIAAHAMGYVAQWLTEWPAYREEVRRHLGHDGPDDRILGFIHIGSARAELAERDRPDPARVISEWAGPGGTTLDKSVRPEEISAA